MAGNGVSGKAPAWLVGLSVLSFAAVVGGQIYGFLGSPPDHAMGHLQKIMYVHVPSAWSAFLCFFIVFWASLVYLIRRTESSDLLAASAAEVGALFTGLTLALGSIWGRPTWGIWWTWDARLTSTAVLFIIFVGYLALRSFTDDPDRRATWSAAVGIFGALNVPIVYMSVRWWRTLHQVQSTPETMDAAYKMGLRLNGIAFLLLMTTFVAWRYRVARIERRVEARLEEAALKGREINV